jgi:Demethylmenaquinone methyltransferase
VSTREVLEEYRDKLWGLIPPERITRFKIERPAPSIIAAYKELKDPTPNISDILDGMGINGTISGSILKPVIPGKTMVGPAVTIRNVMKQLTATRAFTEKGINMAEREAYAVAEPGDVVVVDGGGADISCMGGLSATCAVVQKMAGCVLYGGVRDVATVRDLDYPTWSVHVTPRTGKYRVEAIEINGPVSIAGVPVRPGDLVVADDTGVVVVPIEKTEEVLRLAQETAAREKRNAESLLGGTPVKELRGIWYRR